MTGGELYHYGVIGMKWGHRKYQYKDGTLTPLGIRHKNINKESGAKKYIKLAELKTSELMKNARTKITGKQYVDTFLAKNTSFKRIQTSKEFQKFAFYATYKKQDSDKYMGLFGKNLVSRANKANKDNPNYVKPKVYQLSINATKKLKVPSDENAGYIMSNLLKDSKFKQNVIDSIKHSKSIMKRPTQQMLFKQAQNALQKKTMTSKEKTSVYKALNLSLTNHESYEVAAQNKLYSELKKKGYNALLDYNDKSYSSYHAKRPMIVFDLDSVKFQSVTETNPKIVNSLYKKYNAERLGKELISNTVGLLSRYGNMKLSECDSYMKHKVDNYLS